MKGPVFRRGFHCWGCSLPRRPGWFLGDREMWLKNGEVTRGKSRGRGNDWRRCAAARHHDFPDLEPVQQWLDKAIAYPAGPGSGTGGETGNRRSLEWANTDASQMNQALLVRGTLQQLLVVPVVVVGGSDSSDDAFTCQPFHFRLHLPLTSPSLSLLDTHTHTHVHEVPLSCHSCFGFSTCILTALIFSVTNSS